MSSEYRNTTRNKLSAGRKLHISLFNIFLLAFLTKRFEIKSLLSANEGRYA